MVDTIDDVDKLAETTSTLCLDIPTAGALHIRTPHARATALLSTANLATLDMNNTGLHDNL
jgi:hypothetical protein